MGHGAVIHLGCRVNRTESDGYERTLRSLGYDIGSPEAADVIIVNTCTVTGAAEKKARKAVSAALRSNDWATVLVTGCASALNQDQFLRLSPRVRIIDRAFMTEFLQDLEPEDASTENGNGALTCAAFGAQTRPSIKVQDGCDNRCSYCIVPLARGAAKSLSLESITDELIAQIEAGAAEIVLSGINLGSYNDDSRDLGALLEHLLSVMPTHVRLRLSSIEPDFVSDSLISLMAASDGRICRHLHLPLQSGSNAVLQRMDRHYSAEEFVELCERLRALMPMISLSTDLIVGFPGESEKDFSTTLEVARRCGFSRIHGFPFSPRKGTPAATFKDVVAPEEKRRRVRELQRLGAELARDDLARRFDTVEMVLIEAPGRWRAESYHLLGGKPPWEHEMVGQLAPLRLTGSLIVL